VREQLLRVVEEGLATLPEAMSFLQVSRSTLYELMDRRLLDFVKVGRARRIPRRSLREFAAEHLQGPSRE
jgi:excisionase family DNA binding protein